MNPLRAVSFHAGLLVLGGVAAGYAWSKDKTPHSAQETNVTVHGFRSSFRDWAGDCTPHPRDVVEAALAHAIENAVEAAYRRGTAIEKRRKLMDEWAAFSGGNGILMDN